MVYERYPCQLIVNNLPGLLGRGSHFRPFQSFRLFQSFSALKAIGLKPNSINGLKVYLTKFV